MSDHSKPTITSLYADFVNEVKGRIDDVAKGLDPANTSPSNLPANSIRWTSAGGKWQRWDGATWADLAGEYAISVSGSAAKLKTARTIALSGGVTGDATGFDGSANITINVTALDPSKITGSVPVNKGGTGATDAAGARSNLGLGSVLSDISSLGGGLSSAQSDIANLQTGKQNALGYTPANRAGDTFTGPTTFDAILRAARELYVYGYGGDNNKAIVRLNSAGSAYIFWDGSIMTLTGGIWNLPAASQIGGAQIARKGLVFWDGSVVEYGAVGTGSAGTVDVTGDRAMVGIRASGASTFFIRGRSMQTQ